MEVQAEMYGFMVRKIKSPLIFFTALLMALIMLQLTGCAQTIMSEERYDLRDEAVALYEAGDYLAAIKKFNEALNASYGEVSGLQFDILRYRAECELRTGDYDGALQTCSALMELNEDERDAREYEAFISELNLLTEIAAASSLLDEGEYLKAYELYKGYALLDGTVSGEISWYNMAVCAEYLGNYEEAYDLFSQYLSVYPDDSAAAKEAEFCRSRAE